MSNLASRESFIESEYKKWEDKFEIPFEKEFDVRALLSLQHQFLSLPDEHVKTKADIIITISRLTERLNLKKKNILKDEDKLKVIFVVDDEVNKKELSDILTKVTGVNDNDTFNTPSSVNIKTDQFNIKIVLNNDHLRGQRADFVYKVEPKKLIGMEGFGL
jgi:hypothetical protein